MKKFSLKAAVAAVAVAAAGAASAATGDLYLVIGEGNDTFIADLSGAAPTSVLTSQTTFNLNSDPGWSTFLADNGNSLASANYFLVGTTGTRAGDISFSSTVASPTTSQLNSIFGAQVVSVLSTTLGTSTSVDLTGTGTGTFSNLGGTTGFGGLAVDNVDAAAGTSLTLAYWSGTSGSGAQASKLTNPALLSLSSSGVVTIGPATAVPEPGTYALMAAGLLAVGAIVRRRARG